MKGPIEWLKKGDQTSEFIAEKAAVPDLESHGMALEVVFKEQSTNPSGDDQILRAA